jgi:DNA modification methylase
MQTNKIHHGLALPVIKTFPYKSINCVITSPPYWQLRDYGFPDQWGLEPTFEEYLENLWSLMDEIWRVLKDDGTVWINLGDTYGTVSGAMRDGKFGVKNTNNQKFTQPKSLNKCLLLIPHRFGIGCIDRGWIMRNDVVWAKPNAMPESVTDRFSKKHEYFFFMAKSQKYYFDLDGIRDVYNKTSINRMKYPHSGTSGHNFEPKKAGWIDMSTGKNPGDVSDFWAISTKSSKKDHYATFNEELIEKPIVAGCPEGGIVLDTFCGTGTTLLRAYDLNRNVIGIDGNLKDVVEAQKELDIKKSQLNLFRTIDNNEK